MKMWNYITYGNRLHDEGVSLIKELLDYENREELRVLARIPAKTFKLMITHAESCVRSNRPDKIDYRKAANLYKARYGEDNWMKEIKKSCFIKCYASIGDMIEHMVRETKRVFKGTTHEDTCLFYHDALSLMTAKEMRKWMKVTGYEDMWILPESELFEDDPELKRYVNRPPGNSPELCNLDSCLNEDVHKAVELHVRQTNSYHKDDDRKFSITTPKKRTSAYLRIFDPVHGVAPTSRQILEDTKDVLQSILNIVDSGGTTIDDKKDVKNTWKGKRREAGWTKSKNCGGARTRKQLPDDYGKDRNLSKLHKDALDACGMQLELLKRLFNNTRSAKEDSTAKLIAVIDGAGMCGMKAMKRELQETCLKQQGENLESAKLNLSSESITKKQKHKKA